MSYGVCKCACSRSVPCRRLLTPSVGYPVLFGNPSRSYGNRRAVRGMETGCAAWVWQAPGMDAGSPVDASPQMLGQSPAPTPRGFFTLKFLCVLLVQAQPSFDCCSTRGENVVTSAPKARISFCLGEGLCLISCLNKAMALATLSSSLSYSGGHWSV